MKKFFAIIMSVLMIACFMPTMAFAEGAVAANNSPIAITADSNILTTGSYILNEDVTLADKEQKKEYGEQKLSGQLEIPAGETVTIDLNGHTLTCTYEGISILNQGTLTIKDSSAVNGKSGTGSIYNNNSETISWFGHDVIRNVGTLTIESGHFGDKNLDLTDENANTTTGAALRNLGTATINGGYFTCTDNYPTNDGWSYAIRSSGLLTINGGTVYGSMNGGIASDAGTITINDVTIDVFGAGSFACLSTNSKAGYIIVHGGTFKKSGNSNPILNSFSGMPSWDATADLAKNHYTLDGGTYIVNGEEVKLIPIAKVNDGTSYPTLDAAIAAAEPNDTVKLVNDIALTSDNAVENSAAILINKNITFDGNHKTITADSEHWPANTHIIGIHNGEKVTIKNLTIIGNENTKHGINVYTASNADSKTEVTLENVTIKNCGTAGMVVENSKVTATNLTTSGNAGGAVNVDQGTPTFTLISGNLGEEAKVWSELTGDALNGIKLPANWEVVKVEDGKTFYAYVAPSSSGGSSAPADNVTNKAENTTAGTPPTTTADINASTSTKADGTKTTTATVDDKTADKIVDKAVTNKSEEVVVDATSAAAAPAAGTTTEVALPEKTVKEIAEKTDAQVTIKTDAAEVNLDKAAVEAVAEQAGTTGSVKLVVETVETNEDVHQVELKLETSNGVVSDFKGGNVSVTIKLNDKLNSKEVICVYIDVNGVYHRVEGQKNADGTYTFTTGHFSTYAVMSVEDAEKAFAEQTAKVEELTKAIKLQARSAKTAKGNIKVTLNVNEDEIKAIEDMGYTVKYKFYRSTIKNAKYAGKLETTAKTYTNTTGKKGTKYYYKARVMVYDAEGNPVAKTALTQCKYACRVK